MNEDQIRKMQKQAARQTEPQVFPNDLRKKSVAVIFGYEDDGCKKKELKDLILIIRGLKAKHKRGTKMFNAFRDVELFSKRVLQMGIEWGRANYMRDTAWKP